MNKITYKEHPDFFENLYELGIDEFSIYNDQEHRRGSNYYSSHIIEIKETDKKWFSNIKDLTPYVGFWQTDTVVDDHKYGTTDQHSTLERVEKTVEMVEVIKYKKVKDESK